MRFWVGGPRIFGLRTGVSFGPGDFAPRRAAPRGSMNGSFVYVIRGQHNLVKIGVSTNPAARLATLQTASPFKLELAFLARTNSDGYAIERRAHDLLSKQRTEGEWFDIPSELAASALMGAAAELKIPLKATNERSLSAPPLKDRAGKLPFAYVLLNIVVTFFSTWGMLALMSPTVFKFGPEFYFMWAFAATGCTIFLKIMALATRSI